MCPDKVLEDEVHYRWGSIEDGGDLFELLHDGVSHDRGKEVRLGVESEYSSQLRCADAFSVKMAMTRAME
jgi:hypothetical protein